MIDNPKIELRKIYKDLKALYPNVKISVVKKPKELPVQSSLYRPYVVV